MDVSVIIVNYNTRALLDNCLYSIMKYTRNLEFEIIVVDNASQDGSQEMVRNKHPYVILVESKINLGFGRANNLGFKYSSGKYIFLLNSDTLLIENSISILFEEIRKLKNIGAVGGVLIGSDRRQVHSYGTFPSIKNKLLRKDFISKNVDFNENKRVDYITGADLMIPRATWEKLGGFDSKFFLYYEETDLQKRMDSIGLDRVIIPNTKIIHLEGESSRLNGETSGINEWKCLMMFESMLYYMKKHSSYINFMILKGLLRLKYLYLTIKDAKKAPLFKKYINCLKNF